VGAMAISTRKIRHPFLTQTSRVPSEDYTLYCLLTPPSEKTGVDVRRLFPW
jgi:hypothetical protein